jgi:hypothetical protein
MFKQSIGSVEPNESLLDSMLPTGHLPGTEEKIQVLASRVERKLPLHHPDDAKSNEYRRVVG